MNPFFIPVVLMLLSPVCDCQIIRRPLAAPYIALGAYSLNNGDVFSFTANQASLAELKTAMAGLYTERRFMLAELADYYLAIALPTNSGNFGSKAIYTGQPNYSEMQLGLSYGLHLGNKLDAGVQFNYNNIHIAGYGSASSISFETGIILHVTEKLHTGLHVNNPIGGKFGKSHEGKLPSIYTLGCGYDASDFFFFTAELIKEEDQPVSINAGLQYKFNPQLLFRVGICSATSSPWFGLGLFLKTLRLDLTTSYHPQLGFSPGLLLLFNLHHK